MNFLQDIRYAFRGLRKSPGFAIVAVITLALGIGANTAIFTVVNAVFFHPISVEEPGRLVQIFTSDQRRVGIGIGTNLPVSYPNVEDIQRRAQSLSSVTIFAGAPVSMTINGEPDQYFAQLASANYFDVLGVQAAKGRTFLPQEGQLGAGPVIVLSHGLWQRKFGGNSGVIGQNVLLNGQGFTIIGVAPEHFQGTVVIGGPDMWIPMSMHEQIFSGTFKEFFNERRFLGFGSVARLKDGASMQQAQAELQTIGSDLANAFPLANKGRSFTPVSLLQSSISPNGLGNFKFGGAMMMTVVGIVLLVACFNIANLLLARAAGRKREMAIRVALGASRARIVVQLLTEAMVLATAGSLLGMGLAMLGRDIIWRFRPPGLPETGLNLSLDWHVLLFTVVAAVGTGLIFGLAPALQSSRPDLISELKERVGGDLRAGSIFKLRNLLVAAEVAICLIALVGAGFFLVSLRNAQVMDAGFDTRNLAMLSFNLGALNYDTARAREFERRVVEAAQATPGVKAATLSNAIPLFNGGFGRTLFREGEDSSNGQNGQVTQFASVSPEYLQTIGIPLVRGRGLDGSIREDGPKLAIINETAARRFWPNQEAVGKRFKFFRDTEWTEVIGVARDSKYNTLGEDPVAYTYLPLIQSPNPAVTLFFRANGDPRPVLSLVRGQVQAMDHNLPLTNVWPIGEVFSQALWTASFSASLLSVFGTIAMILCAVGIYGVVGYTVRQRVREIGIRLALGAQPRDVLLMVVKQNAVVMAVGLVFGVAIAFTLSYFLTSALAGLLYGVSTTSAATFAVTTLILALVGLFASYIPARRAAKIDPLVALHYE
jgi:putative ABC transport system permease protein